jgi:hypothetical protein
MAANWIFIISTNHRLEALPMVISTANNADFTNEDSKFSTAKINTTRIGSSAEAALVGIF